MAVVRTVLVVLGMLLLVSCAALVLLGWRDPTSRFLVGFVQTRDVRSKDPRRTAAAACWLILGFAAGAVGLLVRLEADQPRYDTVGYVCGAIALACLAVAGYVRFGEAPQSLRPAAMRSELGRR